MVSIIHISDVHIGDADPERLLSARDTINSLNPDCVLVTGDLTQSGRKREFVAASTWLQGFQAPLIGCPGNHDAPVYALHRRFWKPFSRFASLGMLQRWEAADGSVTICAVNSARSIQARLDWSQDDFGQANVLNGLAWLQKSPAKTQLLALHHPPETPPFARVESTPIGLKRFHRNAQARPPDMILCGHLHNDFEFVSLAIGGITVSTAPSLASRRERGFGSGFIEIKLNDQGHILDRTTWRFGDGVYRKNIDDGKSEL